MTTPSSQSAVLDATRARAQHFFIGGAWVTPHGRATTAVIDPASELEIATIPLGDEDDVDAAVAAAREAFADYAETSAAERIVLLEDIILEHTRRSAELAEVVRLEMGAPAEFTARAQVPSGAWMFACALDALRSFSFERVVGGTTVLSEPIGVCALITPWNWPLHQIAAKVAPALASGCTMVLKPSEIAPLNAVILAEILEAAGVPAGVFNLVQGEGPTVGTALARHPDVDMISITGSTRAGIEVARNAADTVKRVTQELGGKSANVILDDADLEAVVAGDVAKACANSGQSCDAAMRILVPAERMEDAARAAAAAADGLRVGPPADPGTDLGPVVSHAQFGRIQEHIQSGVDQGARIVAGGTGRPDGLEEGYFVKPTVFADVRNDMAIAQEEIFGPVIALIGYQDEEDAVAIANDTPYGLSARVASADVGRARRVARRLRAGTVVVNGGTEDGAAPFGGYKRSGNGREFGADGLEGYLEVKSVSDRHGQHAEAVRGAAWFTREVEAIQAARRKP